MLCASHEEDGWEGWLRGWIHFRKRVQSKKCWASGFVHLCEEGLEYTLDLQV